MTTNNTKNKNLKRLLFAFPVWRESVSICLSFFVWQWFLLLGEFPVWSFLAQANTRRKWWWWKMIVTLLLMPVVEKRRVWFTTLCILSGRTKCTQLDSHTFKSALQILCAYFAMHILKHIWQIRSVFLQWHAQNKPVFNATLVFDTFKCSEDISLR